MKQTLQSLFRDAIGWSATYSDAAQSMEDWDRIADAKAREFAAKAATLIERPASAEQVAGMDSTMGGLS